MREDALDEQRALIDRIERAGWEVTETDLSVYESPWEEGTAPEATLTITARRTFQADGETGEDEGDGDDSPYRVN